MTSERRSSLLVPALIPSHLLPFYFMHLPQTCPLYCSNEIELQKLFLFRVSLLNPATPSLLIPTEKKKTPHLYSSCSASTHKIKRKLETLTYRNWVKTNSDWVEPKRESVCLEVFYLPSKFHVNRSRVDHREVGRSKLPSIWTEILKSNRW